MAIFRFPVYTSSIKEHTGTTAELSSTIDFTDIIDRVDNSSEALNIWASDVVIPDDTVYYIRYKRHFSDGSESPMSPAAAVVNMDAVSSYIPNVERLIIEKPTVSVSKVALLDDEVSDITVTSSTYRGNTEGHYSSTWLVVDENNKVLFKSLEDRTHLTSIVINKHDAKLLNSDSLRFICIHSTASGLTSPTGSTTINTAWTNYRLTGNFKMVIPKQNFKIGIERINPQLEHGIVTVELVTVDVEQTRLWYRAIESTEEWLTVPGAHLESSSLYMLNVVSNRDGNKQVIKQYPIHTLSINMLRNIDISYRMENKLTHIGLDVTLNILDGMSTYEQTDGTILALKPNSDKIHIYRYDRGLQRIIDTSVTINGIQLPEVQQTAGFWQIDTNRFLLDTMRNGKPEFLVIRYDPYNNEASVITTIRRDDEVATVGISNSMLRVSPDTFIYIPTNTGVIKTLDIIAGTSTTSVKIDTELTNGTLLTVAGNRALVLGKNTKEVPLCHIDTMLTTAGVVIPDEYVGRVLKANLMGNGDAIIYCLDNGVAESAMKVLLFDYKKNTIDTLVTDFNGTAYPKTSIELATGDALLVENKSYGCDIFHYY